MNEAHNLRSKPQHDLAKALVPLLGRVWAYDEKRNRGADGEVIKTLKRLELEP